MAVGMTCSLVVVTTRVSEMDHQYHDDQGVSFPEPGNVNAWWCNSGANFPKQLVASTQVQQDCMLVTAANLSKGDEGDAFEAAGVCEPHEVQGLNGTAL